MLQPGKVGGEGNSPQDRGVGNANCLRLPQGQIQRISQEGRKNTYVIIVNKDCIKSETTKSTAVIKNPPILGRKHDALANHPILQAFSEQGAEFDSPVGSSAFETKVKSRRSPDDVKLNLSAINDDEYDSNSSAKNVFLRETSSPGHDSAIEVDLSDSQLNSLNTHARSFFCERNKMNTYVIPSPISAQQQKSRQHSFPMISPQCVGQRQAKSSYFSVSDNSLNNPAARKIFLVTPTPSSTESSGSILQKTVAYTNEAVPVMGRSKINTPKQTSLLTKTNPKAVPTVKNVSPISVSSTFAPINPAASPTLGTYCQGPLTSTPIVAEPVNPRLQQLRQESATHRPVYVIPSPFARNSSSCAETSLLTSGEQAPDSVPASPVPVYQLQESLLNNSSGFISASSSLDMPDSSCSFDDAKQSSESETGQKCTIEIVGEEESMSYCTVSGGVVVSSGTDSVYTEMETDQGVGLESESDPSLTSSQESGASEVSEKVCLNRSLTNIQWLKGMQLKEEKPVSQTTQGQGGSQTVQWKNLTADDLRKISAECGRDSRPPFSYMSMIQMALYSTEDRRMMLKEICKWIEDTFPYYKYTAKPGWKNSIRHNLSLYNIFEREPAKRHGSYWTINPDMEPRTKQYKERHTTPSTHHSSPSLPSQTSGGRIPIIPMYSSMGQLSAITPQPLSLTHHAPIQPAGGRKKGPLPILPRPSAYALIPINNMGSGLNVPGQHPMLVNLSNPGSQNSSACPSPGISEMSAAVASIQMSSSSPIPQEQLESNISKEHIYTKKPHLNIIRQAWLEQNQNMDIASSQDSDLTSSNDVASSSEWSGTRSKSKRQRDKPGLPRPVMYSKEKETKTKLTGSKRRKLQQKERTLLNESSDEEDDGTKFICNLEKEIDMLTTSTPLKTATPGSSQLPSPIRGLTPLRHSGLFEGSFLDTLVDKKDMDMSPEVTNTKKNYEDETRPFSDSHNVSLLDLHELPAFEERLQGSPDSNSSLSNQNLSKILLDYGLDPNNVEMGPESFPNLNWSYVQHMMDNLDTPEKI